MRILITNDDGIFAPGIKLLVQKAVKYGEVIVVAPEWEQSAKSQSINLRRGLKFKRFEDMAPGVVTYAIDSTPADCVRFARYYLKDQFDIVFSGINNGYNLGEDILYSGTVGAATEAVMAHSKAIAFSCTYNNFTEIEKRFDQIMDFIFKYELLEKGTFYNVNVPLNAQGIKITHQGHTNYENNFALEEGVVWQKGRPSFDKDISGTSDVYAINHNYISITPLTVNRTDLKVYEIIK